MVSMVIILFLVAILILLLIARFTRLGVKTIRQRRVEQRDKTCSPARMSPEVVKREAV
jgi:hypothetical protein